MEQFDPLEEEVVVGDKWEGEAQLEGHSTEMVVKVLLVQLLCL